MTYNTLMILIGATCASAWWGGAMFDLLGTTFLIIPIILTAIVGAITVVETAKNID